MQIKPVTKANKPEYPTASEIDIPKVLNASKPKKWKRNAAIGAVMVGMMFSLQSCIYTEVGSLGCIVVSPPVYLSESEAKDIIINELEDSDIQFKENTDTTKGIRMIIQYIADYSAEDSDTTDEGSTIVTKIIPFDYYLDSNSFGLLFVSKYKFDNTNNYYSSIERLSIRIKEEGEKQKKDFVVFKVPGMPVSKKGYWFWEGSNESRSKRISKQELQKQVQDFIKWYKENKGKK